jgi:hypothetical protein
MLRQPQRHRHSQYHVVVVPLTPCLERLIARQRDLGAERRQLADQDLRMG